jgi:hypothetical protein
MFLVTGLKLGFFHNFEHFLNAKDVLAHELDAITISILLKNFLKSFCIS